MNEFTTLLENLKFIVNLTRDTAYETEATAEIYGRMREDIGETMFVTYPLSDDGIHTNFKMKIKIKERQINE
jgi:hypothetical protein